VFIQYQEMAMWLELEPPHTTRLVFTPREPTGCTEPSDLTVAVLGQVPILRMVQPDFMLLIGFALGVILVFTTMITTVGFTCTNLAGFVPTTLRIFIVTVR
jgi:hypothetical protein